MALETEREKEKEKEKSSTPASATHTQYTEHPLGYPATSFPLLLCFSSFVCFKVSPSAALSPVSCILLLLGCCCCFLLSFFCFVYF